MGQCGSEHFKPRTTPTAKLLQPIYCYRPPDGGPHKIFEILGQSYYSTYMGIMKSESLKNLSYKQSEIDEYLVLRVYVYCIWVLLTLTMPMSIGVVWNTPLKTLENSSS